MLGILTDKSLPDIAMTGLEEGYDSGSLRMLAGCGSKENTFQLSGYYVTSLKELNLIAPENREALISVVKSYADKIIDGQIEPYQGFEEIEKVISKTSFHCRDIMLGECYADYISIWEVMGNGLQLHTGTGMGKEQYIEKMKKDLVNHLGLWRGEIS